MLKNIAVLSIWFSAASWVVIVSNDAFSASALSVATLLLFYHKDSKKCSN